VFRVAAGEGVGAEVLVAGLVAEDAPDRDSEFVYHREQGPRPSAAGGDAPVVGAEVQVAGAMPTAAGPMPGTTRPVISWVPQPLWHRSSCKSLPVIAPEADTFALGRVCPDFRGNRVRTVQGVRRVRCRLPGGP
jgi:hypothetical protein